MGKKTVKERSTSPTPLQRRALDVLVGDIKSGKVKSMGSIMTRAGYSLSSSKRPDLLTERKGWKQILREINDEEIIDTFKEIMRDKTDKRSRLQAGRELLKVKDLYPAGKIKISQYEQELAVFNEPEEKALDSGSYDEELKQVDSS